MGATGVINMIEKKTFIHNEEKGKSHDFTYDESFWSQDAADPRYASQEHVYSRIGMPLLDRAMEGYNCCMFAYGQVPFSSAIEFAFSSMG
jgi:hypothetical protein